LFAFSLVTTPSKERTIDTGTEPEYRLHPI